MPEPRKPTTENLKAVEADFIAAVQEQGIVAALNSIEKWMFSACVAQMRDEGGLRADQEVDFHTARLAMLRLWDASREVGHTSTLEGANMMAKHRVRALRHVADDPKMAAQLRAMFQDDKGNSEPVFQN